MRESLSREDRYVPGAEILGAVPLFGLALILVNDHLVRERWPCWLTGKLSDFAVILFFPFLLTAAWSWLALAMNGSMERLFPRIRFHLEHRLTRPLLAVAILFSGGWLAAVNLSVACRDFYVSLLGFLDFLGIWPSYRYVMDPGDCIGLMMMPVAWYWGVAFLKRRERCQVG